MTSTLHIKAPGSKSQTQRALLLAGLARGESLLCDPLECDDSRHLRAALEALGARVDAGADGAWRVSGVGGAPAPPPGFLDCGEGGTTLRFLAPLSLLLNAPLVLDGRGRLGHRPVTELITTLAELGVEATPLSDQSALPMSLERHGPPGPRASVDTSRSSQFVSAMLMAAPCLPRGLELILQGELVSRPYLDLTIQMMSRFGVRVEEGPGRLIAGPGGYQGCQFDVEGDWSGGAFMLAAGWILGRPVTLPNLSTSSIQGDRVFADFFEELEGEGPRRFSLASCPDLVAPLAAACVFARGSSEIVNVTHARHKESDRLAVLARGLREAGVGVEERPDGLRIDGAGEINPARLDPAGDHRMAMAFGLLSLGQPGITVEDRQCVAKSYPGFWEDLERVIS